ncbi:probable zinc transporter protein DDB_G0282067 isoform X2 [Schistocerca gregaria]|nr:probable zinc transporter protein DDB_G0282067 isoform X2 [Schistocerca gregaria]
MSYGWRRTEVVGALLNSSCLIAMCVYVFLEAIPKFFKPPEIEVGLEFLIVAGVEIFVNALSMVISLMIGSEHHHIHGCSHSHEHKKHFEDSARLSEEQNELPLEERSLTSEGHSLADRYVRSNLKSIEMTGEYLDSQPDSPQEYDYLDNDGIDMNYNYGSGQTKQKHDMNIRAVFIHFLGDSCTSVFVLFVGLLIHYQQGSYWIRYVDPTSSLLIIAIILYTCIPLLRQCCSIVLQSVPKGIPLGVVKLQVEALPNVHGVHDLHVWSLIDGMLIGSVHLGIVSPLDWDSVQKKVREIFHKFGIHSLTIQPEFIELPQEDFKICKQNCLPECLEDWCCKFANTPQGP